MCGRRSICPQANLPSTPSPISAPAKVTIIVTNQRGALASSAARFTPKVGVDEIWSGRNDFVLAALSLALALVESGCRRRQRRSKNGKESGLSWLHIEAEVKLLSQCEKKDR